MKQTIVVVGLGLIGGSLAMALDGFEACDLVGVVRSQKTFDAAQRMGVCHRLTRKPEEVLPHADVVWLCQPPQAILTFMETYGSLIPPGALVTDVCGVKTAILDGAKQFLPQADFVGCHPMAGKETSGIENAEKELFLGAHFILTPQPGNTPAHIALLEKMARYMGFRDVVTTTAQEHDAIIAYTSQAMHIMALAVCDDPDLFRCKGFEGGSFRDCTRVAALDVALWTQLFSLNGPALCGVIETLEHNLRDYRLAIESGDKTRLAEKLTHSAERKRKMNLE